MTTPTPPPFPTNNLIRFVHVYRTRSLRRSQRWAWKATAPNGNTVAVSGEGYANKTQAEVMACRVIVDHHRNVRLFVDGVER